MLEKSEKGKKWEKKQSEIPRPPGLLFTSTIQMILNSPLSWTLRPACRPAVGRPLAGLSAGLTAGLTAGLSAGLTAVLTGIIVVILGVSY